MGKLTKAQRDTLVKNIQEKKFEVRALSICVPLGLVACLITWLGGGLGHPVLSKAFWVLLIVSIFGLGYGLNMEEERKKMQAQLDEDDE